MADVRIISIGPELICNNNNNNNNIYIYIFTAPLAGDIQN